MKLERDVFPCAVRLFYFFCDTNEYDDKGKKKGSKFKDHFSTQVFGEEVEVDDVLINELLGIKHVSGPKSVPHDFNNTSKLVEACQLVYNDRDLTGFVNKVGKFDVHTRILHLMISHTFNPRQGGHVVVNKEDIFWMSQIMKGNPPNLREFIAQRMVKGIGWCRSNDKYLLPYGKFVSLMIEKINEVIPTDEERIPGIEMAKLGVAGLHLMKFKYDPVTFEYEKEEEVDEEEGEE